MGKTVMGKSQVIVSTNEVFRVCNVVAVEIGFLWVESSIFLWVWLLDRAIMNWKCNCHFRETVRGERGGGSDIVLKIVL